MTQQTQQVLARIDTALTKGGMDTSKRLTSSVWLADMRVIIQYPATDGEQLAQFAFRGAA